MKQCAHSENKYVHVSAQSWGFSVAHEAIYVCTHLENKYVHEWGGCFPHQKVQAENYCIKRTLWSKVIKHL